MDMTFGTQSTVDFVQVGKSAGQKTKRKTKK